MSDGEALTTVEAVHENRSYVFTAFDPRGEETEIVLLPCEDGVEAWVNRCTHEAQRLATERGAALRDGQIICPKHGSMFDTCSGYCDNGEAAETTLVDVEVSVDDGEDGEGRRDGDDGEDRRDGGDGERTVRLTDSHYTVAYEGTTEDDADGGGPSSSSHLQF